MPWSSAPSQGVVPERVIVIDEEQGQSGQSIATRLGFQRLLAEVSLDHVELILGLELAWHARTKTGINSSNSVRSSGTDADGLYDPTDDNDRLLLGLRGMMNEAELSILKGRRHEGRRKKAKRGDLLNHPPLGYVRGTDGDDHLDPDEQAQRVVRLIFDAFEHQGSLHGLLRSLVAHEIRLPIRPHKGQPGSTGVASSQSDDVATRLAPSELCRCLSLGLSQDRPAQATAGSPQHGKTVNLPESCEVFIKDRFPAYISWQRFEAIQQRLANNRSLAQAPGAPAKARLCGVASYSVGAVVAWRPAPRRARPIISVTRACGRRLIMGPLVVSACLAPF